MFHGTEGGLPKSESFPVAEALYCSCEDFLIIPALDGHWGGPVFLQSDTPRKMHRCPKERSVPISTVHKERERGTGLVRHVYTQLHVTGCG